VSAAFLLATSTKMIQTRLHGLNRQRNHASWVFSRACVSISAFFHPLIDLADFFIPRSTIAFGQSTMAH